jgi:hypothetical protein
MPFGIKIASQVFQEYFQNIFDIPGVEIYIDEILIHAKSKKEHDEILEIVLFIAQKNNVKFNLSACSQWT